MASQDDPGLSPRGFFDRRASQRVESVQVLEDYLTKTRPGKIKAFRKSYKLLENFAAYRESPKYNIIMIIDYYRRRVLKQGKQWMKAERLDSADHVFYLHLDEFRRAEEDSSLDIRLLANSNRDYYAQFNPNDDRPIIVGIEDVTKILKDGPTVELSGGTGMIKMHYYW
jgi:hypothetical protein